MATRLDAGNIQLRQPGGVPMRQIEPRSVQYIAGKAQAESNQVMGQILDRMSAGLVDYAGKLRIEEGLKWSAENQITQEQLFDSHGGLLDTDLGGGISIKNGKVQKSALSMLPSKFNEAVKKATSAQLANLFQQEGNAELIKIVNDIEQGKPSASAKNVLEKINTFTKASVDVLTEVDPEAAIRLTATMATHGNSVYKAALEAESKFKKGVREVKFVSDFNARVKLMEVNIENNPEIINSTYEAGLKTLEQDVITMGLGPEKASSYINNYKKEFNNAKINVVTKYLISDEFMGDPLITLSKIRTGDVGKMSSVLKDMIATDFDSVAKVTANYMLAVNQREEFKNRKRDQDKRNGEAAAIDLLEKIYPIKDVKNPKRVAYVNELMALPPGSIPIGTIKDLLEPEKEGDGNPLAEYNALGMIFDNKITTKEQLDRIPGLNPRQRLSLLKALRTEDKDGLRTLDSGLNKLAGIASEPGAMVVIDQKSEEWKRKQQLKVRVAEIQYEAANEGKVLTERQVIDKMEQEILNKKNSAEAKQAKESLDNFVVDKTGRPKPDRDWITGPVNNRTLPALREKAKNDPKKLRQIQEIERLLKVSEGI
ncbi:hypothetical protein UFOVP382_10 [uncultured Caudovirales phage]|uniref:Uncharacterized protein n=1 Tax=uncultured Caudovirales phage TaxID=2100421 RepID=A0A6J7X7F0_9CAUD|nr:hypothetical protein UFOVP382_10 [uncultured Caudovirales phage]